MKYSQTFSTKNGREILLRSGTASDGEAVLENFLQTHRETDYLLTYPDENRMDAEQEGQFLARKEASRSHLPTAGSWGLPGSTRSGAAVRWRTGPSSASACCGRPGGSASAAP